VCAGLAAIPALLYVVLLPRTADLAAQTYRSELFGRLHFTAWDGAWYAGHHVPGYSVLFPPLGWLLSPEVVAAMAALVAAAAFAALAERQFGPAGRPGTWWFATLGTGSQLFAGRLTFMFGVAFGLLALLALQRGRVLASATLAITTGLASSVAAVFLAAAGAALAVARLGLRALPEAVPPAAVAAAALAPILLLALFFPEGGREPFYRPFFITTVGMTTAALVLLPRRAPLALPLGFLVAAAGALAAYEIATPVGSNVARLGGLFAGPVLACALLSMREPLGFRAVLAAALAAYALWHFPPWFERGALVGAVLLLGGLMRRPAARSWGLGVVIGLLPFAIFQWSQTVMDLRRARDDPATHASYFRPLVGFLDRVGGPRTWRVEVTPMREHWESVEVATRFPLARGWERQLDTQYASLFYHPRSWRHYRAWLHENAVRFVAVPDAPLDYVEGRERVAIRKAIRARPRYLRLRWRSAHWRVYEVTPRPPLVIPDRGARISARALHPRSVALFAATPGSALVRVRHTKYWRLRGGCVSRRGGWTRISTSQTGPLMLSISVTPDRLLSRGGRRCG
jgi:hypothetical protein